MTAPSPILVVEDDPFLRLLQVVLDPTTAGERVSAFCEFFAHDLPDFTGWRARMQEAAGSLFPAQVRLAPGQEDLPKLLPGASALVVESLTAGPAHLVPGLGLVQKFGTVTRNIDLAACAARGIPVRTLRRRANIACAEQTLAMMLMLAKKLHRLNGLISTEQLTAAGYRPGTFDRRHTAQSGWARIPGLQVLYESSLGIVGMGEIGRELALRAAPFGMRLLYHQRTPLSPVEEEHYGLSYAPLDHLLEQSDWVSIQLPRGAEGLFGREHFARMKPGACLINTSQAAIVDGAALLDALSSGRLGGFALDPLYQEPGSPDDPLLRFPNVILVPHIAAQPRFNALRDFEEMLVGIKEVLS